MAERRFSVVPDRVGEHPQRKHLNQHPQGGNCRNDCRRANDGNEKLSLAWSQGSGCDREGNGNNPGDETLHDQSVPQQDGRGRANQGDKDEADLGHVEV